MGVQLVVGTEGKPSSSDLHLEPLRASASLLRARPGPMCTDRFVLLVGKYKAYSKNFNLPLQEPPNLSSLSSCDKYGPDPIMMPGYRYTVEIYPGGDSRIDQ